MRSLSSHNPRKFKFSVYIAFLFLLLCGCHSNTGVWTYDVPEGSEYSSADYTVSVEQNGR